MEEFDQINGIIEAILFENEENGYAVLKVRDGSDEIISVTGCFPDPVCGEEVELSGKWTEHKSYGRQFSADRVYRSLPSDEHAIKIFLSNGGVKGIGPATATLIVGKFGEKSLEILADEPEKLATIRGISIGKAMDYSESYRKATFLRRMMEYLGNAGIKPFVAMNVYKLYGSGCFEMVKENPYILTESGIGCNFREADILARTEGIEHDNPSRLHSAVLFELRHNLNNGHCFIPRKTLTEATAKLTGVEVERVAGIISEMLETGELISDGFNGIDAVYLPELHEAEEYCARRLGEIRNNVMIVTGPPGSGKSTMIKELIDRFGKAGLKSVLAAPTGRAAKRMEELSGDEAATIHRLLGASLSEDGETTLFSKNENDRLECGALILDECSMVDIILLQAVLKALPDRAKLVLVGDADQLPPVGPGNVFRALIASEAFETKRLTEIYRQKGGSRIIQNAIMINRGEYPDFGANSGDFFRLKRFESADTIGTVCELCSRRLPDNMHIDIQDIQVISPTRKGELGTINLNRALQDILNPPSEGKNERPFGERVFREGDRVMQIKNDYEISWHSADMKHVGTGIFNGDTGYIKSIDNGNEYAVIDFDGRLAAYSLQTLNELEHSWAVTVHKSQGSEYRAVVLVLSDASRLLLTRDILYTAVTRARDLLVMVGDEGIAKTMIDNGKRANRYSFLRLRIRKVCGLA